MTAVVGSASRVGFGASKAWETRSVAESSAEGVVSGRVAWAGREAAGGSAGAVRAVGTAGSRGVAGSGVASSRASGIVAASGAPVPLAAVFDSSRAALERPKALRSRLRMPIGEPL